jgi:hypothetical protein
MDFHEDQSRIHPRVEAASPAGKNNNEKGI